MQSVLFGTEASVWKVSGTSFILKMVTPPQTSHVVPSSFESNPQELQPDASLCLCAALGCHFAQEPGGLSKAGHHKGRTPDSRVEGFPCDHMQRWSEFGHGLLVSSVDVNDLPLSRPTTSNSVISVIPEPGTSDILYLSHRGHTRVTPCWYPPIPKMSLIGPLREVWDENGKHGHASSVSIIAFLWREMCLAKVALPKEWHLWRFWGEGTCNFQDFQGCKKKQVKDLSKSWCDGISVCPSDPGITKDSTMPSRITAMVALCTTLSVRQTGAMGAETSLGPFQAPMIEIFQTHGHGIKPQVTCIAKLHIYIMWTCCKDILHLYIFVKMYEVPSADMIHLFSSGASNF